MIKKSPNLVTPIPRRNNEIRDEEIDNDDGVIYPPGYSVATASPISMNDPNILPLAPAVLIGEHNTHSAEEGRVSSTQNSEESHSRKTDSRFDPFRPIHPQCNHISYGCLTMVFVVFVGMAVLLKTYLPDILPPSNDESVIPSIKPSSPPSTRSNPPSISKEPIPSPSFLPTVTRSNPPSISTEPTPSPSFLPTVTRSNPPSMYLSHPPSINRFEEKIFASDGSFRDFFGASCSISDELVVIGATQADGGGAAYLFHLDGTEVKKLTRGNDVRDSDDWFGWSVSIDEKIVIGTGLGAFRGYVRVFSREGIYERSIKCNDCLTFGTRVATHGNLIAVVGEQNNINKLFIYGTQGELLKTLKEGSHMISDDGLAISEQFIVSTGSKTFIYSNSSPDFPEIVEIDQGGWTVAVAGDRIVIGDPNANNWNDGAAWLYKTDGTLVKTLDRQDASSESDFGWSVDITDNKVFVGASEDDDQGFRSGSVFIYSAVTGEFIEKVSASDGEANDYFGYSICASDSYYIVGAPRDNDITGSAYLFQFSDE